MAIFIATASILVITALAWLVNNALPFKICPICAGVSLTWILLTVGVLSGKVLFTNYYLLIAILMGGTVVGIAYQGEKRFKWAEENIFRFRVPVVVLGFILVYLAVLNMSWLTLIFEGLVVAAVTWFYFVAPYRAQFRHTDSIKVKKLEEEMKNCC